MRKTEKYISDFQTTVIYELTAASTSIQIANNFTNQPL